jgi:acyl-CoA thioesterase I
MQWVIYLFGSGLAFFIGAGCLLVSIAVAQSRWRPLAGTSTLFALLGLILVVTSGTPLPVWYYAIVVVLVAGWLGVRSLRPNASRIAIGLTASIAITAIIATILELRYQFPPAISPQTSRHLYLFGDSLAAGVDDHAENNWPQLIADSHDIELTNLAIPGATISTALRKAREARIVDGVVLLEIGGNDLLASAKSADFERELDDLLSEVCRPGRTVVMFELPLPPFHNAYGQAQRRLSAKYGVSLIPKRLLMGVLTSQGGTLDSIHLTATGNKQMAEQVWAVLKSAYAAR